MSIRPIDMQVSVQKSADISRTQNNESTRPEVAQQQFSQKLQKEVAQRDQQVVQSNKTEGRNIDKDGRGGNSYERSSKKKNPSKKDSDGEKDKRRSSSLLDISI